MQNAGTARPFIRLSPERLGRDRDPQVRRAAPAGDRRLLLVRAGRRPTCQALALAAALSEQHRLGGHAALRRLKRRAARPPKARRTPVAGWARDRPPHAPRHGLAVLPRVLRRARHRQGGRRHAGQRRARACSTSSRGSSRPTSRRTSSPAGTTTGDPQWRVDLIPTYKSHRVAEVVVGGPGRRGDPRPARGADPHHPSRARCPPHPDRRPSPPRGRRHHRQPRLAGHAPGRHRHRRSRSLPAGG